MTPSLPDAVPSCFPGPRAGSSREARFGGGMTPGGPAIPSCFAAPHAGRRAAQLCGGMLTAGYVGPWRNPGPRGSAQPSRADRWSWCA
eukprot:6059358-Pleurochrysis_carterae.AAC.1